MKTSFIILLKLHPSTLLWMFSWNVSKQFPCKHGVEIKLVQRCFSIMTLKQHWNKVISTPYFCRLFIWTSVPAWLKTPCTLCKGNSLPVHLKTRKQLMKVAPWKKLFFNCVNINIKELMISPISSQYSDFIPPGNNRRPKVFSRSQGVQKRSSGLKWVKKLDLFLPNVPFSYSLKTSEKQRFLG